MELGPFSISLAVKDIQASRAFYEKLGFKDFGNVQQFMQRSSIAPTSWILKRWVPRLRCFPLRQWPELRDQRMQINATHQVVTAP
jgi:hypothetical protein